MKRKEKTDFSFEVSLDEVVDTEPLDHVEDAGYHLREFAEHLEALEDTWVSDVMDLEVSIEINVNSDDD